MPPEVARLLASFGFDPCLVVRLVVDHRGVEVWMRGLAHPVRRAWQVMERKERAALAPGGGWAAPCQPERKP